jgi:HSP20 family protein
MNLVPWKSTNVAPFSNVMPFSRTRIGDEISSFQRDINNLMSTFFNRGDLNTSQLFDTSFSPSIDLKEKDDKYLLDADMPGMNEADIDIDFHNNTLTIRGEKKSEMETKEAGCVCVERSYGSFRRDIPFDEEIDQDNIKADLKNGVLHVELIKKEKSKTPHKKIAIKH